MNKPSLVEALGQARMFLQAEIEARVRRVLAIRVSTGRAARASEIKKDRWSASRLGMVRWAGARLAEEELALREEEKSISFALVLMSDPTEQDAIYQPLAVLGRFRVAAMEKVRRRSDFRILSRFFSKEERADCLRVICRTMADAAVGRDQ